MLICLTSTYDLSEYSLFFIPESHMSTVTVQVQLILPLPCKISVHPLLVT